ncbi:AraC family transcriptional regulator [Chryseobacterium lactis]|uniref:AraC family transcriptional regulator n=1 Tax=Chryseobacterium lactis TaxID=1241981 RepID=A0A3G6RIA4_CHRLC|nr:helix-turn-helix domain-containing protein [Chryseobacterium lactis]AZA84313.1 AraC family transcriptional regulator [Chryseobacterium lactis]AZB04701.1 AraC family transcriptional regulator [Chryseobacterium lactis]PNW14432.1 AraC family transcriptional regulator [Chryseobacterium lactis]
MKQVIKIPESPDIVSAKENSLKFDDYSVLQHSFQGKEEKGMMYMENHALLFVLEGHSTLSLGEDQYEVGKNEMTLLRKATGVLYERHGNLENNGKYCEMMFSISEDMISTFLATTEKIIPKGTNGKIRTGVHRMSECLITFTDSLRVYFDDSQGVYSGQLRLKMTEMLYHLGIGNDGLFQELLQLRKPVQKEIQHIVEQYYTSSISMEDLASLSGRSISSFKRDFKAIYNMAPAAWIRKKRLDKAREMLESTQLPVAEICFSLGFENISHFSRIFKEYHGQAPTFYRTSL